jgi:glycosyltransferase involved in cell wall biosynthesis
LENLAKKKRVLIFVGGYLPGFKFGGPIRSISNMVDSLGHVFDFHIVTLDRDLGDDEMYKSIEKNKFNKLDQCVVKYLSNYEFTIASIKSIIKDVKPDLLYLNGFFGREFCLRLFILKAFFRLKQPIIVAPRGEFSNGALSIKPNRKRIYLWFFRILKFPKIVYWHATNPSEKKEISAVFGNSINSKIYIASNISKKPNPKITEKWSERNKILSIAFLSRISPKKNLLFAIKLMKKIDFSVRFYIYGTVEDKNYWKLCQQSIQRLPSNIKVVYEGELLPQNVVGALATHDVFLFPTKGENYGHVIFEALSAGMIILISDKTPWNKIEKAGAGWALPLTRSDKFLDKLSYINSLNNEDLRKLRNASLLFAQNYASTDRSEMDVELMLDSVLKI